MGRMVFVISSGHAFFSEDWFLHESSEGSYADRKFVKDFTETTFPISIKSLFSKKGRGLLSLQFGEQHLLLASVVVSLYLLLFLPFLRAM